MNEISPNPPLGGDLLQRVQDRYGKLRPSEQIVADYLRTHAHQRLSHSITELAQIMGVSEATISRVSRALGYSGFSDLRLSLAEGAVSRSGFSNIPAELDPHDTLVGTSVKLANLLAISIQATQASLDADKLDRCLTALRSARKIVLAGCGGAAAICDEAAHLFMKAGLDAASYSDGYTQIVAAANLTPDCLMIGISHTGTTQNVANALTLAREVGARTIAITSDAGSIVAQAADIVLTTATSSAAPAIPLYGDFLEGRISQLFLIDMLYLGLIFEEGSSRGTHLTATAAALERYFRRNDDGGRVSPDTPSPKGPR
jgi:RpiR family transcriptional regulator, carbohydrate utilization regulator